MSGVWVEAGNGGSGWADLTVDTSVGLDGFSKLRFTKWLPAGGPVTLHVGCGGSGQEWGSSNVSEPFEQPNADVLCNNLPWWVKFVQKRFAPNPLRSFDLSQGVPTGECALVE